MTILKFLFLFAFLVLAPIRSALAQGIPVYDAAGFAQMISQVNAMAQDYAKQLEQLDEAVQQRKAMTGARNAGDILNGALEKQLREYLPNTWEDTMNLITANDLPASAFGTQGIYTDLINTYDPVSGADTFSSDPTGPLSHARDRRTSTTYAAMAASEQAFDNINDHIQIYESLLSELNNTPDLKASVDLQARISAENGMLLSELMRLNAIQIQQKAALDNERLTNLRRAATANKYDPVKAGEAMKLQNNN